MTRRWCHLDLMGLDQSDVTTTSIKFGWGLEWWQTCHHENLGWKSIVNEGKRNSLPSVHKTLGRWRGIISTSKWVKCTTDGPDWKSAGSREDLISYSCPQWLVVHDALQGTEYYENIIKCYKYENVLYSYRYWRFMDLDMYGVLCKENSLLPSRFSIWNKYGTWKRKKYYVERNNTAKGRKGVLA